MDEFEETLNRVLSDPEQLGKITRLAGQLMGDGEERQEGKGPEPGILGKLVPSAVGGDDKSALVKALAPFLKPDRQQKLKRAMRLAKTARVAGAVMEEFGGENGV